MNFFPLPNEPAKRKQRTKTSTVALPREDVPYKLFTDEELYAARGGVLVFDVECYPNYWMVGFRCFYTDKIVYFERTETQNLDIHKLLWVLHNFTIVGFNNHNYDNAITWLAMQGVDNITLKHVSDFIIRENWRLRDIEAAYKFKAGSINSIDIIEVAPLSASLKAYAARLHAPRLQELPFNPENNLSPEEQVIVRNYNFTDLEDTLILLRDLCPQLELRAQLSKQYGLDLRSKSDPQVAEAILCGEIKQMKGFWTKRPVVDPGTTFKYKIPDYIKFQTPLLQKMLEVVKNADFVVAENGQVLEPKEFEQLKALQVGSSVFRMGLGGLHSTEENISYTEKRIERLIIDRDCASYYPNIILNLGLYPQHLGTHFLDVYQSIVERRLRAKRDGDKVVADSLKICVNGSFGKLSSKYSALYSPDLLIQVTLTGQLALLMLIEMIELEGIPVISANTDGIIIHPLVTEYEKLNEIITKWESITNFETEECRYKAVYSRDINNYIAIKEDGSCKAKGAYGATGLSKNPAAYICIEAVKALLTKQTPIEETIRNCKDVTRFVSVIKVTGGGEKDGIYLGKTCRFYYAKGVQGCISRVANGNKVPKTDGAKPCQDLPSCFPSDLDYERYVQIANSILYEIGYYKKEVQQKFF